MIYDFTITIVNKKTGEKRTILTAYTDDSFTSWEKVLHEALCELQILGFDYYIESIQSQLA